MAERFHFYRRDQSAGETISEYIAELRRLSTHCEFQDGRLEEALRDRLVCGLRNEAIQRKLLTVADLTFDNALKTALGMEAAERSAQQLKGADSVVVQQLSSRLSQSPSTRSSKKKAVCYRCGKDHLHTACPFKDATCHYCGKTGHLASVCRTKLKNRQQKKSDATKQENWVQTDFQEIASGSDSDPASTIFQLGSERRAPHPITVTVLVNNRPLQMELDTGAAVSIISEREQHRLYPHISLRPSHTLLRTYTGAPLTVAGEMTANIQYQKQTCSLPLVVVAGDGPALLGRDWLKHVKLDWKTIGLTALGGEQAQVQSILHRYPTVFSKSLGKMTNHSATLHVPDTARPIFCKPRPVPYSLREDVGKELDRLESIGVLEKVPHAEWAAPLVVVPKKDGTVRLCGDYKQTVNRRLEVDQYPLPKPNDLFSSLSGGQKFTKLDLTQAYQQLPLDPESQKYCVVNTHQGLYRYKRLPFGVASAPAIFQRVMDIVLQGIPRVHCYIDDVLISGATEEEHLHNLELVLSRLAENGITLKQEKCSFLRDSIEFLGHKIDSNGLHTSSKKVEAVVRAPRPTNQQQLRSFLGLLQYYCKFLPNLSTLISPLNRLLQKNQRWRWTSDCERAFQEAKQTLSSAAVLVHYNPDLPLVLATDASAYGIGAVISHICPNGEERPIAYVSGTLTSSERNYSQLDKEALSIVNGVRKFHQYLYGRKFVLLTDHKPLTTILSSTRGVPPIAAARLQRWALFLSAYTYDIKYRSTSDHANADCLSRLPLPSVSTSTQVSDVFIVKQIEALPVSATELRSMTRNDPLLSKVLQYTRKGWPSSVPAPLKPYFHRREELTLENDCVLWGIRVIVPKKLQDRVLEELHQSHIGIAKTKALARSHVWWPNLDSTIEAMVKSCSRCQAVQSSPAVSPLHPWAWPSRPWQRIHIDYAGPFLNKHFLVLVDAHSKWPEVIPMTTTTSSATIRELRRLFAAYGLPEQLVSDNGPQFVSDEFQEFLKKNRVKHLRSAPYHPSTNGLAERFVGTLKRALRASAFSGMTLHQQLMNFLLTYRTTPHASTGVSPASLFLNRHVRTRLDMIHPSVSDQVETAQSRQKNAHDSHSRVRSFIVGQRVLARNYRPGPKWIPGTLISQNGPLSFEVQISGGIRWKRHVDQLLAAGDSPFQDAGPESSLESAVPKALTPVLPAPPSTSVPSTSDSVVPTPPTVSTSDSTPEPPRLPESPTEAESPNDFTTTTKTPERRYPQRVRRPPSRYSPSSYYKSLKKGEKCDD